MVASFFPERDPPYSAARAGFMAWCDAQGASAPKSTGRPYESFDDGVPMVLDDAAVLIAAGHAAQAIIPHVVDGQAAAPEAAWLLIGFKKGWVFDGHAHTIRMSVGASVDKENAIDAEAGAFALSLVKEAADARSDSE